MQLWVNHQNNLLLLFGTCLLMLPLHEFLSGGRMDLYEDAYELPLLSYEIIWLCR